MTTGTNDPTVHRLAAFTTDPNGGNPAGVVITDEPLPEPTMQRIAADVGYSETAFLSPPTTPRDGTRDDRRFTVRYFSPEAEVSFCGHATIASGIVLGRMRGAGTYELLTVGGPVRLEVAIPVTGADDPDDVAPTATLTSIRPEVTTAPAQLVDDVLAALHWAREELDPTFEPAIAAAGARHLLLVAATRDRLAELGYAFDALRALMADHDLTTVALLWREHATRLHARNPFPPGGVVEDPATGAAAAAVGAYLRDRGHLDPPATIRITQGVDMGRPSELTVHVPTGTGGIRVTGTAVPIP